MRSFAAQMSPMRAVEDLKKRMEIEEDAEKWKDEQTLQMAKSDLQGDTIYTQLMVRDEKPTMHHLESFFTANQQKMNAMHHSVLLFKVNQVYKEAKKKSDEKRKDAKVEEQVRVSHTIGNGLY